MFPYDYELEQIKARLQKNNLSLVLCNLPAGKWTASDRGTAADPSRKEEFKEGIEKAIAAATFLGVSRMNCLVGLKAANVSDKAARDALKENLFYAATKLAEKNILLLVEPLNHHDMPGFALNSCRQVIDLLGEIDHPNAFLQFDVYHARRENEDLSLLLGKHIEKIGHIQIADCPGRHQPGTGETDFKNLFFDIDRLHYQGYVSLEYIPDPDTLTSLKWFSEYGYPLKKDI
jgi:hydroxypyruvate isomerase